MVRVLLVVGARPQFIKSAPVVAEILRKHRRIDLGIVHSGQHYDLEMSEIFFRELEIPRPMMNLEAGSGSHAVQTSAIMKRLERLLLNNRPDTVVVPGDTNTTLAGALSAAKLGIPVAHLEAGLRSGDISMPEEINRRLTDHCSTLLFAPTKNAVLNLRREGLGKSTCLTGDTMADALRVAMPTVRRIEKIALERFGLRPRDYVVVTLHRPSNVDDPNKLRKIMHALRQTAGEVRIVFPAHPRTRARLAKLGILGPLARVGVTLAKPQSYIETLSLVKNAACLLTDSGGMQKEAFLLHVPCLTLRATTEWPETLAGEANILIREPEKIHQLIMTTVSNEALKERIKHLKSPFGDGHASGRIAHIIESTFQQ